MASSKNKITLDFPGIKATFERFEKMDLAVGPAVSEALQKSYDYVTSHLEDQIEQHHRTGRTAESLLKNEKVQVEGTTYYINVGFDVSNGGLASIFLMYGSPKQLITRYHGKKKSTWNHPGMDADQVLYDLVFGKTTKQEIAKRQKKVYEKRMEGLL